MPKCDNNHWFSKLVYIAVRRINPGFLMYIFIYLYTKAARVI